MAEKPIHKSFQRKTSDEARKNEHPSPTLKLTDLVPKGKVPQKPYILRLRTNVLRECISYLSDCDFLELCRTCTEFFKLLNDRFVSRLLALPKPFIDIQQPLVSQLSDCRLMRYLSNGKSYPSFSVEWKNFPVQYFHYCIFDSRKVIFLYYEHSIEIKEVNSYSSNFYSIYSKRFKEKILNAKGYKNIIFLLFESKAQVIILNSKVVFENFLEADNVSYEYSFKNEVLKNIRVLNNGRNVVILTSSAVWLFSQKLILLSKTNMEVPEFNITVPTINGKTYIVYYDKFINVYKVGTSDNKVIKINSTIEYLRTSHFLNRPQIVASSIYGEVFLGKQRLNIRCNGKFKLQNELFIYAERCERFKICIYNLEKNTLIFTLLKESSVSILQSASVRSYFFIFSDQTFFYIYDLSNSNIIIWYTFDIISQCKVFENMILITSSYTDQHAVIYMDLANLNFSEDKTSLRNAIRNSHPFY